MSFSDGFAQFGNNAGVNIGNVTTRPTFIINDSVTWIERRAHAQGRDGVPEDHGQHPRQRQSGRDASAFGRGSTGLVGVNSGSPIASFLLGAVDSAERDVPRGGLQLVPAAERVDLSRRRHAGG